MRLRTMSGILAVLLLAAALLFVGCAHQAPVAPHPASPQPAQGVPQPPAPQPPAPQPPAPAPAANTGTAPETAPAETGHGEGAAAAPSSGTGVAGSAGASASANAKSRTPAHGESAAAATPRAAAPGSAASSGAAAGTAAQPAPSSAPSLDLAALEQRLRDTRAIGVFTKLSLKNQVDDLLGEFRSFHRGAHAVTLSQLRQQYDLLLLKVLSLLQDGDPPLAAAISSSREAIWRILVDPQQFEKLARD